MSFSRFSHCVRIDRFVKTAYVSIPKAGCSSIQRILANSWADFNGLPPVSNPHSKRGRELLFYWDSSERPIFTEILPRIELFTVVRNPYSRLLSAWLDKVRGAKKEGLSFAKRHRLGDPAMLSFADFVDTLYKTSPDYYDHHWATQVSICNITRIPYSHVGSLENIDQTLEWISALLPTNKSSHAAYAPHGTSSSNKLTSFYDDEVASKVYSIYRDDFTSFGYSPDISCLEPIESIGDRTKRVGQSYELRENVLVDLYDQSVRISNVSELPRLFLGFASSPLATELISEHDWQYFAQLALKHSHSDLPAFLPSLLQLSSPKSKVIAASVALKTSNSHVLAKQLAESALAEAPWLQSAHVILKRVNSTLHRSA
jgi:hypothetical protein